MGKIIRLEASTNDSLKFSPYTIKKDSRCPTEINLLALRSQHPLQHLRLSFETYQQTKCFKHQLSKQFNCVIYQLKMS